MGPARAVYLVKGDDPSLVAQAAHALVEQLVGGGDPSLMVEEFGGPGVDQFDVGAVIDACTTPPFLVERRVVVVREAGQLTAGRRQAAGRLPAGAAGHHGPGAGGGGRHRPPGPDQGGRPPPARWWTPRWGRAGPARSG